REPVPERREAILDVVAGRLIAVDLVVVPVEERLLELGLPVRVDGGGVGEGARGDRIEELLSQVCLRRLGDQRRFSCDRGGSPRAPAFPPAWSPAGLPRASRGRRAGARRLSLAAGLPCAPRGRRRAGGSGLSHAALRGLRSWLLLHGRPQNRTFVA